MLHFFSAQRWAKIFLCLFFLVFPFGVDALVLTESVYSSGFFNSYLSQFVYVGDLVLLLAVFFWCLHLAFSKEAKFSVGDHGVFTLVLLLGGAYFLSLAFSESFVVSFVYFLRFVEFVFLYLMIVNRVVKIRVLLIFFVVAVFFQALIGLSQYVLQQSLGLRFFGEPLLSSGTLGVAKVDVGDEKFLRIYGTFPHPNVFAGYLGAASLVAFYLGRQYKRFFYYFGGLFLLALVLTFSRSAFLALVLVSVFFLFRGAGFSLRRFVIFTLLFGVVLWVLGVPKIALSRLVVDSAAMERLEYFVVARNVFESNLLGIGAGAFTAVMQGFSQLKLLPWEFQPVHNIFVLQLVELGVFGGIVFVTLFVEVLRKVCKKMASVKSAKSKSALALAFALILFIAVVGLFDHYLVTLYSGMILFWLVFGVAGALLKDSRL